MTKETQEQPDLFDEALALTTLAVKKEPEQRIVGRLEVFVTAYDIVDEIIARLDGPAFEYMDHVFQVLYKYGVNENRTFSEVYKEWELQKYEEKERAANKERLKDVR